MENNQNYSFSYYKNVKDSNPKIVTWEKVITTIKGSKTLAEMCSKLQVIPDKKNQSIFKQEKLPAITVSGLFKNGHSSKDLTRHSGLIQIDFDDLEDPKKFKALLSKDPYSFAVFISPSGKGIKVLVKIKSDKHLESFLSLSKYYQDKYNLPADEKCKDVGRLCFLSYDPDIVINDSAKEFILAAAQAHKNGHTVISKSKEQQIEKIIESIELSRIDITNDYQAWLNIAFALSSEFGEYGRSYFHRVSKFHPDYDSMVANQQYDKTLNAGKSGITIKTFFDITAKHGIYYKTTHAGSTAAGMVVTRQGEIKKNGAEIRPEPETTDQDLKNLPLIARIEAFLLKNFEFRHNVVLNRIECRKLTETTFKEANENDISRFLQYNHFKCNPTTAAQILGSEFVKRHNPFIDYFNSLTEWDGHSQPDYIDLLCEKITVFENDKERFSRHFKKHLVRSVACSLVESDCNNNFNKQIFTFVSPKQSLGKSSFIRWLCPPDLQEYFTENISFDDKDGQLALAANFIINLDELASLSKHEHGKVKTVVSKSQINVRPPFGRRQISIPRRCNFFASTNDIEFLTDETGSARWLCFQIEEFEYGFWIQGNKNYIDINKVWSQAYSLYKSGFKYKLANDELLENEFSNEAFQLHSEEMQYINTYLKRGQETSQYLKQTTQIKQYLSSKGVITAKLSDKKIGSALRKLGFKQGQARIAGNPVKGWFVDYIIDLTGTH